jgi:hypothetical protein
LFVPTLEITWNWSDSPTDPDELTATGAELAMRLGDDLLTLVEDPDGGYHRTVSCSLYPLADWIARNWWSLIADARPGTYLPQLRKVFAPSIGSTANAWRARSARHALRTTTASAAHYPDLLIVTEEEMTRLNWQRDAGFPAGASERYLTSGEALVESTTLAATLSSVVESVIARLASLGVRSALPERWAAIRDVDPERAEFCRAAAWLGLNPDSCEPYVADAIRSVREQMDKQLAVDFLNAIRPGLIDTGISWVEQARTLAAEVGAVPGSESGKLADLRAYLAENPPLTSGPPHLRGWDLATRIRRWAKLADREPFDPGFLIRYRTLPMPDPGVVAFASRSGSAPTVVGARYMPDISYRFLQARVLWHVLTDDNDEFLITATHTGRQHAGRAFSVELLAPARGVVEHLGNIPNELISSEDLGTISMHYVVGDIVVEHQLDIQILSETY